MWVYGLEWAGPGQGQVADACECGNEPSGSVKCGELLDQLQTSITLAQGVRAKGRKTRAVCVLTVHTSNAVEGNRFESRIFLNLTLLDYPNAGSEP